jgi:hypothetical protein
MKIKMKLLTIPLTIASVALVASGQARPSPAVDTREALDHYCVDCHNNGLRSGGLPWIGWIPHTWRSGPRSGKKWCASFAPA